jgi:hypothetical protein
MMKARLRDTAALLVAPCSLLGCGYNRLVADGDQL